MVRYFDNRAGLGQFPIPSVLDIARLIADLFLASQGRLLGVLKKK